MPAILSLRQLTFPLQSEQDRKSEHKPWKSGPQPGGLCVQPCPLLCVLLQDRDLSENALLRRAVSCQFWHTAKENKTQRGAGSSPSSRFPSPTSQEREAELTFSAEEGILPLRSVGIQRQKRSPVCRALELCGYLGNMGPLLGYDAQAQMVSPSP